MAFGFSICSLFFLLVVIERYASGTSVLLASKLAARCIRSSPPAEKKPNGVSGGKFFVLALSSARLEAKEQFVRISLRQIWWSA